MLITEECLSKSFSRACCLLVLSFSKSPVLRRCRYPECQGNLLQTTNTGSIPGNVNQSAGDCAWESAFLNKFSGYSDVQGLAFNPTSLETDEDDWFVSINWHLRNFFILMYVCSDFSTIVWFKWQHTQSGCKSKNSLLEDQRHYYSKLCSLEGREEAWKLKLLKAYLKVGRNAGMCGEGACNRWETDSEHRPWGCCPRGMHSVIQCSLWMSQVSSVPLFILFLSQINKGTLGTHWYMRSMWPASYHHYRSWNKLDFHPILWVPTWWEELNRFLASHGDSNHGSGSKWLVWFISQRGSEKLFHVRTNKYDRIFDLIKKVKVFSLA